MVGNRDGTRVSRAEIGTITREADTSISVRFPQSKRAIKLIGLIYEREFTPRLVQDIAEEAVEDRNRLQGICTEQRRNFERHVREGVNAILKDIDREL